ncbi:multiple epidermal growth factor-like domains protein 10 [Saccostrea cucullata]|uniref:multiple epidermal growth factor-like domains protein 10 n=1 Tax=Saccostrea cuccullata TaxID=36930 RepID=UPI002ED67A7C
MTIRFTNHSMTAPSAAGSTVECDIGYIGVQCNRTCPYPSYGFECQQYCKCQEELCDFALGCRLPECRNGYKGLFCNSKCVYPNYGYRCLMQCDCSPDNCDYVNGCQTAKDIPTVETTKIFLELTIKNVTNPCNRSLVPIIPDNGRHFIVHLAYGLTILFLIIFVFGSAITIYLKSLYTSSNPQNGNEYTEKMEDHELHIGFESPYHSVNDGPINPEEEGTTIKQNFTTQDDYHGSGTLKEVADCTQSTAYLTVMA